MRWSGVRRAVRKRRTVGPDRRTGPSDLGPSDRTLALSSLRPFGPLVLMRSRIYQPEIMDEETLDQDTVDEIYRYLASVNRYLGGVNATIARFEAFSRNWRAGERIEVLEIACGAADVPEGADRVGPLTRVRPARHRNRHPHERARLRSSHSAGR